MFLSIRRERKGEGDNEGFQGIPPLNILNALCENIAGWSS